MRDDDRRLGLAHARTRAFHRRLEVAREILARGLAAAPTAYVSFSAGKDSAVCLHLAAAQRVPARILLWSESVWIDSFAAVIAAWRARGAEIAEVWAHRDHLDERGGNRWGALTELAPTDGYIVGLRADESRARALTLRRHGPVYQRADGRWRIAPIAWWTTVDVIAYHAIHDLPMLSAYETYGLATRTATRVPRQGIRHMALTQLRHRDRAAWAALVARYPEAADYV